MPGRAARPATTSGADAKAPTALAPPTLATVLEELGPIVQVVAAPGGLGASVARPVIHDPQGPPPIEAGDIVLAVGTPPTGLAAVELVGEAAAAGAAAVVFRGPLPGQVDGPTSPVVLRAAADAGIAVVSLASPVTWSQLHTLLRTTTAVTAAPGDGTTGAVPLGDLFGLANAIAEMVGGPTTIEDRESTVLAYSNHDGVVDEHRRQTILGHRVPEEWRRRLQDDGVFRRLWTEPGPTRLDYPDADPPLRPRLAIALRAGEEILGSIWVAEGDRPFDAGAERALTELAPVAALHLIRWRSSEDVERERRGALLRAVLEGTAAPELLADSLDVAEDAFVTVVAFRLHAAGPEDVGFRARRARDLIVLYCESFRRKAASVAVGPVVYVLLPEVDEPDRDRLVHLANDVIERVRGPLATDVAAAIGSTERGLANVAVSRRRADQVLQVLVEGGVGTIEGHRPATILLALRDQARRSPEVLEGPLAALRAHDEEHRSAYVETLRAYLDAFGDVPAAAASIGVHQNTFRYRLRRLLEISDLRLDDPVARLVLHLQLHLAP
jgi:hypothetical protein